MERINITYSVRKEDVVDDLCELIVSSEQYLEQFSEVVEQARHLLANDNQEGCIKNLAQARDFLADADFRLHDVMNTVIQLAQHEQQPQQQQQQYSQTSIPHEEIQVHGETTQEQVGKMDKLKDRMAQVRKNIDDLGIELPEEELENIMGRLNDQTSRGV